MAQPGLQAEFSVGANQHGLLAMVTMDKLYFAVFPSMLMTVMRSLSDCNRLTIWLNGAATWNSLRKSKQLMHSKLP